MNLFLNQIINIRTLNNICSKAFILIVILCSCDSNKTKNINESAFVQILFLGHNSEHHHSEKYLPMLASELAKTGIHFTYTTNLDDLNPENLSKYDGLAIYANHEEVTKPQEKALIDFVQSGKGLIPIHCASACFKNSDAYIEMVGGQFESHGTGTFQANLTPTANETIDGLTEFETWDETYVHHKLNPNNKILMERVDKDHTEPWTWVNTYGKGRVFYTAYGHDERTWSHQGFHKLMEKGILWAVGDEASNKVKALNLSEPMYSEAEIPNYEKRNPALKLQEPLSPEESMKLTQIPVGFELELFASEPDIINPVAMAWDERGRLWVIETVDYPNTVRDEDGVGDDRIKICEDTNGDGKADKFTVFADKLNIPTSLVFANGGIIVSQAPHFLFLKDTNNDDKADVREVIVTGWGTYDTHAGPSNLRYGFDNKIWGTVGYSGYEGVVDGAATKFRQGIYNFNSDGTQLEQHTKTSNNTWGLGFSENFDVFASTANNTHSVFMGISNKYLTDIKGLPNNGSKKIDGHYAFHPISEQVRQVDVFGGFTAAAGHSLYTARSFPEKYWNRIALVTEPTGRLVHNAILEDDGSGFKESDDWNLIASNDNWFAPVQAEVGPDGAVWIADWYNFIIQHNPTPSGFENGPGNAHINPLRDRAHGRIYRLSYKGAENYTPISLSKDNLDALVETLGNNNLFWRLTAQRLLVERKNKDVIPALLALINNQFVDEIGINAGAIHALWTLHGLGIITNAMPENISTVVNGALNHPSAGVRKAAIQVLAKTDNLNKAMIASGILTDANKHTQLAAILALAETPASAEIGKSLFELSINPQIENDDWLSQAVYLAAINHKASYFDAMQEAQPDLIDKIKEEAGNKKNEPWGFGLNTSEWETVEVPGYWRTTKIGNVDGTIWFRKEIAISSSLIKKKGMLHLGPINDSDETYINGVKVGGHEENLKLFRKYQIPTGALRPGKNVVAVKVTDIGGRGGFSGDKEDLELIIGGKSIPLAGEWKYQIESLKGQSAQPVFNSHNTITKAIFNNYYSEGLVNNNATSEANWPSDAKVINIKTIVNEMKYDISSFEIEAGQAVEIRFNNNDFMQHNLLVLDKGSLKTVGAAADKLATSADGAAKNYVPDIPQVLYATKLVDPESEAIIRFIAPATAGDYPFVCTFPGHWTIMNGIMKVTPAQNL